MLWLALFLVLFGLVAVTAVHYAALHRFNDRIAIALAAISAGAIMIALRARFLGQNARRP